MAVGTTSPSYSPYAAQPSAASTQISAMAAAEKKAIKEWIDNVRNIIKPDSTNKSPSPDFDMLHPHMKNAIDAELKAISDALA